MNIRYSLFFTGRILKIVAFMFLFPTIIALVYGEYDNLVAFLPMGAGAFLLGFLLTIKPPKSTRLTATEGFVIVSLSWVLVSFFVAFSFFITGEIEGGFINCLFESVSGFSTTGATVVGDVEGLSKSVNAVRLFTHWVGGMGILVLVLAIIPKNVDATTMNVFRAEVPGHQVEKFTNKIALTAKILYLIYTGMTVILAVSFMIAKMPVYDSIVHAMSIAGTGGFSVKNASLGAYGSVAIEVIATVFMFLFGVNLNIFYLILIGKFTTAIKSEELRVYVILYVTAVLAMAASLTINNTYENFGTSLRYASFQAAAIVSTTGMSTANFASWTALCQAIIFVLMFIGGSSGSTAGGIKLSRIMIAVKYSKNQLLKAARPNRVKTIRLEGERLDKTVVDSTIAFLAIYFLTLFVSFILITILDDILLPPEEVSTTIERLTATISCLSNVGPGFGDLAVGTYDGFSVGSKILLCFDMLAGRLEILPMLFLFNPMTWTKVNRSIFMKRQKKNG